MQKVCISKKVFAKTHRVHLSKQKHTHTLPNCIWFVLPHQRRGSALAPCSHWSFAAGTGFNWSSECQTLKPMLTYTHSPTHNAHTNPHPSLEAVRGNVPERRGNGGQSWLKVELIGSHFLPLIFLTETDAFHQIFCTISRTINIPRCARERGEENRLELEKEAVGKNN